MNTDEKDFLQIATYMCPSFPVEYYEYISNCLEKLLGMPTSLIYDSKNFGPGGHKTDNERIDLAFVSTSSFVENYYNDSSSFNLVNVGAVSKHPVKGQVHGYYTDVLLHKDLKGRVKEFDDLRGSPLAYAGESSLSSAKQLLVNLKQMGENSSFFSTTNNAGSHVGAIERVIAKKAEVATISSISLTSFLNRHYYLADEVYTLDSWGPLPPEPIIYNKSLPGCVVVAIQNAFLKMDELPGFDENMEKFGIVKFECTSEDSYLNAIEIMDATKKLSIGEMYY